MNKKILIESELWLNCLTSIYVQAEINTYEYNLYAQVESLYIV